MPRSWQVTANDVTVEVGKSKAADVAVDPEDAELTFESSDEDVATVDEDGVITGEKIGTAEITVTATADGYADAKETFTVNVIDVDTEKPVITLVGDATMNLTEGDTFTDPGATVTDNVDTNLTATVTGTVDATKAGTYTLTYNATDAAGNAADPVTRTVVVKAKVVTLDVTSVTATNLHQIAVVFSTEVDKTTAERTSNYTLSGVTVNSALLQSDEKTVVLNLYKTNDDTAALAQSTDYSLVIGGVKSKDLSKTLANNTSKAFKSADSTIPTVSAVTVLGNKALRVAFSEPVKATAAENIANYGFVGEAITIASVALDKNTVENKTYTYATVNLTTALTPGDHKFRVNGTGSVTDFANFAVVPQDFTVNVPIDTAAPTVSSVVAQSRTTVVVTFSEAVKSFTTASEIFWNTTGSLTSGSAANTIEKVTDDKYKVTFTTSPLPVGAVSVVVKNDTLTDYSNNKMAANVKTDLTVSADSAPSVNSVVVYCQHQFKIEQNHRFKNEHCRPKLIAFGGSLREIQWKSSLV